MSLGLRAYYKGMLSPASIAAAALAASQAWAGAMDSRAPELKMPDLAPIRAQVSKIAQAQPVIPPSAPAGQTDDLSNYCDIAKIAARGLATTTDVGEQYSDPAEYNQYSVAEAMAEAAGQQVQVLLDAIGSSRTYDIARVITPTLKKAADALGTAPHPSTSRVLNFTTLYMQALEDARAYAQKKCDSI